LARSVQKKRRYSAVFRLGKKRRAVKKRMKFEINERREQQRRDIREIDHEKGVKPASLKLRRTRECPLFRTEKDKGNIRQYRREYPQGKLEPNGKRGEHSREEKESTEKTANRRERYL